VSLAGGGSVLPCCISRSSEVSHGLFGRVGRVGCIPPIWWGGLRCSPFTWADLSLSLDTKGLLEGIPTLSLGVVAAGMAGPPPELGIERVPPLLAACEHMSSILSV